MRDSPTNGEKLTENVQAPHPRLEKLRPDKRPTTSGEKLRKIEWLLTKSIKPKSGRKIYTPSYGNLAELNTSRVGLRESVGFRDEQKKGH